MQPKYILLILAIVFSTAATKTALADEAEELNNTAAFTRLFGYTRYFHPSDAGAELNWDRFAVIGNRQVRQAASTVELQQTLQELFHPFAPTIQIFPTGQAPDPVTLPLPTDDMVAWQHTGVGLSNKPGPYKSIRTNREHTVSAAGPGFGTATQCVDVDDFHGQQVRFSASVKADVEGSGNTGNLWLRVDRPSKQMGFFDNMRDRPITTNEWQRYEINGVVADDATRICIGGFLKGNGQVWLDDMKLEVSADGEQWREIPLNNSGFEEEGDANPEGWHCTQKTYRIRSVVADAQSGERCATIVDLSERSSEWLFDRAPTPGEMFTTEIGAGLSCRIPLTLSDESAQQVGAGLAALTELLAGDEESPATADDVAVRLADVVVAWNIFQHFYPYFDVVGTDWEADLMGFLQDAYAAEDAARHRDVLRRLVAKLKDGHGNVWAESMRGLAVLQVRVALIEDQVAVVWVPTESELEVGDVIMTIDGVSAREMAEQEIELGSGSLQWRRKKFARSFGMGVEDSQAEVVVERDGKEVPCTVTRTWAGRSGGNRMWTYNELEFVTELKPGIWYVNLDQAPMEDIDAVMDELATARGVIFDLRGYPKSNHMVIGHLLSEPDTTAGWMQVPETIYPNRREVTWRRSGWQMKPLQPHIEGKVVFLTNGQAISYAESFMGFIEGYKLGEIVGGPTAGTNGNINPFAAPSGARITWTGMRVVKHNGQQQHLIGITPTVPLQPTLAGLREGRDEYVAKALEIIGE